MVGPMQEIRRRKVWGLGLRIAAPKLGRALALLLLVAGLAAVGISYWRLKGNTTFRLRPGVKLSGDQREFVIRLTTKT